jgi:hypothetical protein
MFEKLEEVLHVHERLRVSDKHIAIIPEMAVILFYKSLFGFIIKIDHHIPAKDDVKGFFHGEGKVHKVKLPEGDHVLYLRAYLVTLR